MDSPQQVQEFFTQRKDINYWQFLGITGWKWGKEADLTQLTQGTIKNLFFNPHKDNFPFTLSYSYKGWGDVGYPPIFKPWLHAMFNEKDNFYHGNFKCSTDQYWTNPGKITLTQK
ncbi:MAG: hypothetical protein GBAus27B_000302 [Mycoplasmataceae bacterium]|nr:MAG: hypothetical protein GBAus27B_000302 [Mycoplasmataceae bacterium]